MLSDLEIQLILELCGFEVYGSIYMWICAFQPELFKVN